jgi:hypothetical protein
VLLRPEGKRGKGQSGGERGELIGQQWRSAMGCSGESKHNKQPEGRGHMALRCILDFTLGEQPSNDLEWESGSFGLICVQDQEKEESLSSLLHLCFFLCQRHYDCC